MAESADCIVSRMSEVRRIMSSPEWRPVVPGGMALMPDSTEPTVLLNLEGPVHRAHRQKISDLFAPRAMPVWEATISEIAQRALHGLPSSRFQLGESFARPLAQQCAFAFIGIEPIDSKALAAVIGQLFSPAGTPAYQKRVGLKLIRLLQSSSRTNQDRPVLMDYMEEFPEDATITSLTMLTAGTEVLARGLLACIANASARIGPAEPSILMTNTEIDSAISHSEVLSTVRRVHSDTSVGSCNISLRPTQSGSLTVPIPFGWGPHYCLSANWTRLICRTGVRILSEQLSSLTIERQIHSCDSTEVVSGIVEVEAIAIPRSKETR